VTAPKFSVVIPAYNEANYLPYLLDSIEHASSSYRGRSDAVEVIVADNNSRDQTAAIAIERRCLVRHVVERNIATVRNAGAEMASGELFCFVDADMRIHAATFNAIEQAMSNHNVVAGSTRIKLENNRLVDQDRYRCGVLPEVRF
jgi:glycosyltransferase involved in cell wall biosynthesis